MDEYTDTPADVTEVAGMAESATADITAAEVAEASATDAAGPARSRMLLIAAAVVAVVALGAAAWALLASPRGPEGAIEAINKATRTQDTVLFQRHFDAYSVGLNAYPAYIEKVKETTGYAEFAAANGEDAAAAVIAQQMPEKETAEQIAAQFSLRNYSGGIEMFPSYTITSSSVEETSAEIELVSTLDGEETTWILVLAFEEFSDREVWRVKEIRNISDFWVADEEAESSEESTSTP